MNNQKKVTNIVIDENLKLEVLELAKNKYGIVSFSSLVRFLIIKFLQEND